MGDVTESDWKLFRKRLPGWQESYMEKLVGEYMGMLSGEGLASEKFWALEKRVNEDKRRPKSLGEFAEWLIPNKKSFLSMHVEMRNSLTHRDSAGMARYDPQMLAAHSQGVLVLSYGAILIRLGLSDDEVIDIVKHSRFARITRKFRGLYPSN